MKTIIQFYLVVAAILGLCITGNVQAKPSPTVHWKDTWHNPNGSSWWFNEHWRTRRDDLILLRSLDSWGLPNDGGPIVNVWDTPTSFMPMMFSLSVMDDHMNTLVHRSENDLVLMRDAWLVDHTENPDDGIVFHLLEDMATASDGYQRVQAAPISIPMSLISSRPGGAPGEIDLVFVGTVPTGGASWHVLDPAAGVLTPQLFSNDEPFDFEFAITIPEPASCLLVGWVAAAGLARRRSNRTAE